MGNFYTNITLRTGDQASVVNALRAGGRDALVSHPEHGCTVVFDSECEEQDLDTLHELADTLSQELRCPALAVLDHDDDVLSVSLHENGRMTDRYDSAPGYFESGPGRAPEGGDAARWCQAFASANVAGVESVLRAASGASGGGPYVFEVDRHDALVQALGLPTVAVGTGYNYIEDGEYPPGTSEDSFMRTA